MAIDKYVRANTREELREVAKLARASPTAAPFREPFTSGYVDLAPFAPPAEPAETEAPAASFGATADPSLLTMPSGQVTMAPVSLSALVSSDEPETIVSARRRRRTVVVAAVTGVLCLGLALGAVVKHVVVARRAERAAAVVAAPPPAEPVGSARAIVPLAPQAPPMPVVAVVAPPTAEQAKPASAGADPGSPASHKKGAPGHAAPPAHASAVARTVPVAAHLPKSTGAGTDPLMDAIRQSVAAHH